MLCQHKASVSKQRVALLRVCVHQAGSVCPCVCQDNADRASLFASVRWPKCWVELLWHQSVHCQAEGAQESSAVFPGSL